MKLSEILGWGEKKSLSVYPSVQIERNKAWNAALKFCDRETDRDALAEIIERNIKIGGSRDSYLYIKGKKKLLDEIISTMPKWLKPTERK